MVSRVLSQAWMRKHFKLCFESRFSPQHFLQNGLIFKHKLSTWIPLPAQFSRLSFLLTRERTDRSEILSRSRIPWLTRLCCIGQSETRLWRSYGEATKELGQKVTQREKDLFLEEGAALPALLLSFPYSLAVPVLDFVICRNQKL